MYIYLCKYTYTRTYTGYPYPYLSIPCQSIEPEYVFPARKQKFKLTIIHHPSPFLFLLVGLPMFMWMCLAHFLPLKDTHTHIFTIIDRTTCWDEAVTLSSTTAASCARAFCTHWVSRFDLPHIKTSDRGPQFTSSVWAHLTTLLNITHITTTGLQWHRGMFPQGVESNTQSLLFFLSVICSPFLVISFLPCFSS